MPDVKLVVVDLGPYRVAAEIKAATLRAAGFRVSDVFGDDMGLSPDLAFQQGMRIYVTESDLPEVLLLLNAAEE